MKKHQCTQPPPLHFQSRRRRRKQQQFQFESINDFIFCINVRYGTHNSTIYACHKWNSKNHKILWISFGIRCSVFDAYCISFEGGQFHAVNDRKHQNENRLKRFCIAFSLLYFLLFQTFHLWELMSKCHSFTAVITFTFIEIENHTFEVLSD